MHKLETAILTAGVGATGLAQQVAENKLAINYKQLLLPLPAEKHGSQLNLYLYTSSPTLLFVLLENLRKKWTLWNGKYGILSKHVSTKSTTFIFQNMWIKSHNGR